MKNLMKKIRKANKGFTLVELIIVVAIIAVLSAVAAPQYIKYVERSRQGVDASTLEEVRHAVEVEAAMNPPKNAAIVTIDKDGKVETPAAVADGKYENLAQVTDIVGTKVELKSKAATKDNQTFQIDISTEGVVTWHGTPVPDNSQGAAPGAMTPISGTAELITKLQAGTAS